MGEDSPGAGEKQGSGQAGVGLLLLSRSESVSLELPHPWCSALFLGSDEPEPRGQNHEEQEQQQPLGQEAEVSRLLRRVARIWGRRRQGERGSPGRGRRGGPDSEADPQPRSHRGVSGSRSIAIPLPSVSGNTCSNHRSSGAEIRGTIPSRARDSSSSPLPAQGMRPHGEEWGSGFQVFSWEERREGGGSREPCSSPGSVPRGLVPAQKGPAGMGRESMLLTGLLARQV